MNNYIKFVQYSNTYHKHVTKYCFKHVNYESNRFMCDRRSNKLLEKYSSFDVEKDSSILNNDQYIFSINKENASKDVFSIVLPPPNITGSLHLGHALTATIQDVLCRWKRMNGFNVCWLPGIDHAGIATQAVVEKYISKNNTNKQQIGYRQFQDELWKWKERHELNIEEQLKMLGMSLDWSRKTFTMDENQSNAVKEAFIQLFEEGLIYRTDNLVNWSCHLRSTISDIEVQNMNLSGYTYLNIPGYLKPVKFGFLAEVGYKVDDSNEEIVVATTRPETILGDVAIAVHPEDMRYSHLKGSKLKHPFTNKTIPLILDDSVDMKFGTGAVKITPAHDKNDYIVSKKHRLDTVSVINKIGIIEDGFSKFSGMKRYDARESIMNELSNLSLLRNVKEHAMLIPICSRSGDVVEQLLTPQWYIDCKKMSQDSLECIRNGSIEIIPNNYEKMWCDWSKDHNDWCISRQLWWGHRIPLYKCYMTEEKDKFVWIAAHDDKEAKLKCGSVFNSSNIVCEQEKDVLDTWFSSAIYPFSSHGWPNATSDYKELYPLDMMITGHDILRFWVHKMVMLGIKLTGKVPFSKVLLHGIICDLSGAKMSKSKGNVIDPYDVIGGITLKELKNKTESVYNDGLLSVDEYKSSIAGQIQQFPNGIPQCGADALRFTLCSQDVKKTYINFAIKDCNANKLFCNKIWQSMRYANGMTETLNSDLLESFNIKDLGVIDLWLLSRLASLSLTVNESIDKYDFYVATRALYKFLYNEMCDVYVECTKQNYRVTLNEKKLSAHCQVFSVSFNTALRLLSPFMPFVVDQLIDHVPLAKNSIYNYDDSKNNLVAPKYEYLTKWKNEKLENDMELILDIVSTIRQLKVSHNIKKHTKSIIYVHSKGFNIKDLIKKFSDLILYLTVSEKIFVITDSEPTDIWDFNSNGSVKIYLSPLMSEDIKTEVDLDKLRKKRMTILKRIERYDRIMSPEGFKTKVPKNLQLSYENKMNASKEELKKIENILNENETTINAESVTS